MKLWLSKQYDGKFMLTAFRPVTAKVRGTSHADIYVRYGDPVGTKHLCSFVEIVWPEAAGLSVLQSIRVTVSGDGCSPLELIGRSSWQRWWQQLASIGGHFIFWRGSSSEIVNTPCTSSDTTECTSQSAEIEN